ncbi:hypothetical protein ACFYYH_22920 [Streptomyces sp. NPDC002018]|uniref:hypothetical protein n=1 Tax=Streptomyces sp. NPDC002018 TaxID=3364629 RepID=UPI0036B4DAC5
MTMKPETDQRRTRPREVETAFLLLLAAIVVDAAVWVLDTFVLSPSGLDEMRNEMGESGAIRQVAMSAGFLVFTSALFLFFVFKMREGRKWARSALAASGALVMFFLVNSMNTGEFHKETMMDVIYDLFISVSPVVLVAGAVVLMFLPTANMYFSSTEHSE